MWGEFVRRFQPLTSRVVKKTIRRIRYWKPPTPQEVDDLVQDTFLKLCANNFRALRNFDCQHDNALYGFMKVVASNVAQDYLRSAGSEKRGGFHEEEDLEKAQNIAASSAGSPETAERNILIREVGQCLESLAAEPNFARDSMIFWLYYQQGLTAKAISELPGIGLTVKGVESTLLRLTRLVREKIKGRPGKPGSSGRAAASRG